MEVSKPQLLDLVQTTKKTCATLDTLVLPRAYIYLKSNYTKRMYFTKVSY